MVETNESQNNYDNSLNSNSIDKKDINTVNSMKSVVDTEIALENKGDKESSDRVKFKGLDNVSLNSEVSIAQTMPTIPDGGWGWVVVVAAFLVSACADGLAFSFGLLHKEFTKEFKATQSQTSLIGGLFIATPLLAGPIMSALVDRYGCRVMTIMGGIFSTLGFLLAAVSNSIPMLCLTFGFMSGLAMGILYVTAVVSVAFWFDKRRNLAVSLASCGIGFGTFAFPPMIHYFLEMYTWRSTIILLAGTLLNMCVCGALMRNPEWLEVKQKKLRSISKAESRRSSASSISTKSLAGDSIFIGEEELKALLKSGQSPEYILAMLASSIEEAEQLEATTQMNADPTFKRMHSAIQLPTFVQQNEKVPPEVIEKLIENKRLYNVILKNYPDLITRKNSETNANNEVPQAKSSVEPVPVPINLISKTQLSINNPDPIIQGAIGSRDSEKDKVKHTKSKTIEHQNVDSKEKQNTTTSPTNWFSQLSTDHHYLRDMPLYKNTIMLRGAMLTIPRYRLRASSLPDMYRNSMVSLESETDDEMKWYDRVLQTLKTTFDFKMFAEFHFLMFNLSSLILSVWFIIPYFFLESYMTEMKIEGGAMMISIIGITSTIGIVALGWAGDQPWINVTKTYAGCLIVCGLSVALYPPCITSNGALAVVSAIFGLSFASSYSYTPAILIELMPVDRFTVAYGLILLSQGIGHLIGPPIGGMLYDLTKSWDLTFYMAGFWLVISGICVGVIAYTKDMKMCGRSPLLKESEEAKANGIESVPV